MDNWFWRTVEFALAEEWLVANCGIRVGKRIGFEPTVELAMAEELGCRSRKLVSHL